MPSEGRQKSASRAAQTIQELQDKVFEFIYVLITFSLSLTHSLANAHTHTHAHKHYLTHTA